MHVQLILREEVPNLGQIGDVVKVRAGFARNYLLPRKLAVEANPRNLREFQHQKRQAMARRETGKALSMALKARIEAITLVITARAGEEGKLFGSVTNLDIERELRQKGFDVERRKIHLAEPIKQLGEFTVTVKLDPEVEASIKLNVVAE